MIAIISSTIEPSTLPSHDGARTNLPTEQRLQQTLESLQALSKVGISEQVLLDNSASSFESALRSGGFQGRYVHCPQPAFQNKGIGEIWMLKSTPLDLPEQAPVLKLSARYLIQADSPLLSAAQHGLRARLYGRGALTQISTRAYGVSSLAEARRLWTRSLHELYALPTRIRGPRSLWQTVKRTCWPLQDDFPYGDPPVALELAILRAAQALAMPIEPVAEIGVRGMLGSWINPMVSE